MSCLLKLKVLERQKAWESSGWMRAQKPVGRVYDGYESNDDEIYDKMLRPETWEIDALKEIVTREREDGWVEICCF